jgi:hypothetical protein
LAQSCSIARWRPIFVAAVNLGRFRTVLAVPMRTDGTGSSLRSRIPAYTSSAFSTYSEDGRHRPSPRQGHATSVDQLAVSRLGDGRELLGIRFFSGLTGPARWRTLCVGYADTLHGYCAGAGQRADNGTNSPTNINPPVNFSGKNATLGPRPLINLQSAGGKREKSIVLSFRAPVRL